MDRKPLQGPAIAVIAGSLLVVVGCLMTWFSASGGFLIIDRSGVDYSGDAAWMIVLAVTASLAAVGELLDIEVMPLLFRASAWLDGLIIGVLAIYDLHEIRDRVDTANFTPGVSASVGEGVYVAIAGAVLIFLSGLRLVQARKALGTPPAPDELQRFAQQDEDVRA